MSEQLSQQTYFDQAIGFTFSYYDIPEVDQLVMKLENQIEQLKAETRTDNSAVIEKMATEIAELKKEIESMKVKFREFNDNVCKKIVDVSRTMSTISQDAQMDFYEEFINEAK